MKCRAHGSGALMGELGLRHSEGAENIGVSEFIQTPAKRLFKNKLEISESLIGIYKPFSRRSDKR
jgi:hypothetical protein